MSTENKLNHSTIELQFEILHWGIQSPSRTPCASDPLAIDAAHALGAPAISATHAIAITKSTTARGIVRITGHNSNIGHSSSTDTGREHAHAHERDHPAVAP